MSTSERLKGSCRLQHKKWTGSTSEIYCAITEHGREVAPVVFSFRPVNENSGGTFTLSPFHQPDPSPLDNPFLLKKPATDP
ncbi:hypothetical protein EVAR_27271_1 [Eumeta japonica]|uniref:Uncharacterized protein n=1 Tax=Eumeta variegata TaxID=151549 RepID=A0A4C1W2A2_EUMVA|nr:hypothetical protein EVAR_27271_1 [Eumeta japonica]